jgi:hypothetical protein
MADRYKGPIPKPKRMLKEFNRKRALSSGPSLKGPNAKNIDPNFIMKREPKNIDPNFEMKMERKNIDPNFEMKDQGFDFPMSKEGSPTVTDTETGETTYGSPRRRPKHKKKGGMIECRGGGIAITGKKFQGVF